MKLHLATALLLIAGRSRCLAQVCAPGWSQDFGCGDIDNGYVGAFAEFDEDGPGPNTPVLYATGNIGVVSGLSVRGICRFYGRAWAPVGSGFTNDPAGVAAGNALAVFDTDNVGPLAPSLIVGGQFGSAGGVVCTGLARWDGAVWYAIGSGVAGPQSARVNALCSFDDDGAGPAPTALYVGGYFTSVSGLAAPGIARWDGSVWTNLPPTPFGAPLEVRSLLVFDDDGPGPVPPALYIGGDFYTGGTLTARIARWDGITWSIPGGGIAGGQVQRLIQWNRDPSGTSPPALVAAGQFTTAGSLPAQRVALWDGAAWSSLSTSSTVLSITAADLDGPGPDAESLFHGAFGGFLRWNGSGWDVVPGLSDSVYAMKAFDNDGTGPNQPRLLVTGGTLASAGGLSLRGIASWDGTAWHGFGGGIHGSSSSVSALAFHDEDGPGPATAGLYVGGAFNCIGDDGATFSNVARYDGVSWGRLAEGLDSTVACLAPFDEDGGGPNPASLFAAGTFLASGTTAVNRIARWDGSVWSPVAGGTDGPVQCLAVFDPDDQGPAQPALMVGGRFANAGGTAAGAIARWNGAAWDSLGAPATGSGNVGVYALAVADLDGPGPIPPALFVGGIFSSIGGVASTNVAKWNGSTWSVAGLPPGASSGVNALTAFDPDGIGPQLPKLVAGGAIHLTAPSSSTGIAEYNGSGWTSFPVGILEPVNALAVADVVGSGVPTLFAGGSFRTNAAALFNRIVRWNGATWTGMDGGLGPGPGGVAPVQALAVARPFGLSTQHVFVGGQFSSAGSVSSFRLASWGCAQPACYANCDSSTTPPALNTSDFACFLNRFAAADSYANCDGSTTPPPLNVADFACFLNRFAAGCP